MLATAIVMTHPLHQAAWLCHCLLLPNWSTVSSHI